MKRFFISSAFLIILAFSSYAENYILKFSDMKDSLKGIDISNWTFTHFAGKDNVLCLAESTLPFAAQTNLPEGNYHVWVDSFDLPKKSGQREFDIAVNSGKPIGSSGTHGMKQSGWLWSKIGKFSWNGGNISASILPRVAGPVRVHALLFAEDANFNPNNISSNGKQAWMLAKPLKVEMENATMRIPKTTRMDRPQEPSPVDAPEDFAISNSYIKITYSKRRDSSGKTMYVRSVDVMENGRPVLSKSFPEEIFFVGYNGDVHMFDKYFAEWSFPLTLAGGGKLYVKHSDAYRFEKLYKLPVRSVEKISDKTLRLNFDFGASALCSIDDGNLYSVRFDFEFPARENGYFSAVFLGFNSVQEEGVRAVSLPPIYHRRTFMRKPSLVCDRVVSQPYAAVQFKDKAVDYTCAVIADPKIFDSFSWPTRGTSRCGFSISGGVGGKVGIAYFQPIMGGLNSYKRAGEKIYSNFYAMVLPGDWDNVARNVNSKIYSAGQIVRQPEDTSLSDAISNIIGCLSDADAGGWSDKLKARWNIEGINFATSASPLSEISIAILTRDEDYYWNRALPTIEYVLSRNIFHFTTELKEIRGYASGQGSLRFPCSSFGEDFYLSANALTGNLNPVFVEAAEASVGSSKNSSWDAAAWATQLGAYLATSNEKYLLQARNLCDAWLQKAFWETSNCETDSYRGFVNVSNYPQWWYLPDLYEITQDNKYLRYAVLGAYHSAVSAWNFPEPPLGAEFRINRGGLGFGLFPKWYRGNRPFRLGSEARDKMAAGGFKFLEGDWVGQWPLPERTISGSKASRLGLGVEGVSSLTTSLYGDMNILMASWSAEILLAGYFSGDTCLKNLSRHGIIGRFGNYPGYYVASFDDTYSRPDYPYKGPDITSIYYHHIPCFFAQSLDYLMAEYLVSSRGEVKFRHLRQKGYVWFVDRIYGLPGSVYGNEARPMISPGGVEIGNPKINSIFARGKNDIWVLFLNDSSSDEEISPKFNFSAKAFEGLRTDKKCLLYADGKLSGEFIPGKTANIKIPSGKIVALRFQAQDDTFMRGLKPLAAPAHRVFKSEAEALGEIHIFRIRSPFGKDSVFVSAFGSRNFKGKFVLEVSCGELTYKSYADSYPFEASVKKLPMDKTAKIKVFAEYPPKGKRNVVADCEL